MKMYERVRLALWALWFRLLSRLQPPKDGNFGVQYVVFSKDRACQLHLLLETLDQHLPADVRVNILFRASTEEDAAAYMHCKEHFASRAEFIPEVNFGRNLVQLLESDKSRNCIFLVDDIAVLYDIPHRLLCHHDASRAIVSLRLGANIVRSYNSGISKMQQPLLEETTLVGDPSLKLLRWRWRDGVVDWSLPTSLDGHLMPKSMIMPILRAGGFKAPNSLEHILGQFRFIFKHQWAYALPKSVIINFPMNAVNSELSRCPHLGIAATDLRDRYMAGERLSLPENIRQIHDSVHMETQLVLAPLENVGYGISM
jgi:hypothetical protein